MNRSFWWLALLLVPGCPAPSPPAAAPTAQGDREISVGALTAVLDDLDSETLEAMRAQIGCDTKRDVGARAACAGLVAFAGGARPDANVLVGKRRIGVGVAIAETGVIDPKLELLALDYRREPNFHAAVELGDEIAATPVIAQSADEAAEIARAAAAVAEGTIPAGNHAFEFAQTMEPRGRARAQATTGISVGITGDNRRLLRQGDGKLVLLEVPRLNTHVKGKRFWVQVFSSR